MSPSLDGVSANRPRALREAIREDE